MRGEGFEAQGLGRGEHRLGLAGVGPHRPVVIGVGAPVEQVDAGGRPQRRRHALQGRLVAAFTDVGHTLDQPHGRASLFGAAAPRSGGRGTLIEC